MLVAKSFALPPPLLKRIFVPTDRSVYSETIMNAQITKSTAVITGASSGIGAVYADTTENVYWVLQFAINPGQSEDLQTLMAAMPG